MDENVFADVMDALDDVLETERSALLAGDLDAIGRLVERKEMLIEKLSLLEATESAKLEKLSGKIKRNQELLDQALEGIRTVASRLAELRRIKSSLDTYDSNGAKRTIEIAAEGSVEKRA